MNVTLVIANVDYPLACFTQPGYVGKPTQSGACQNNATTRAPSSYSPHRWLGDGCVCDSDEAAACGGCGITIGDCEEMLTHTTHSLL